MFVADAATAAPPFAAGDRAARWTQGVLLATLALSVVGAVCGLLQLDLISRMATGGVSAAELAASDSRQRWIGVLKILMFPARAFFFMAWLRLVHGRLAALGARDLKYTPGSAVWGFFVPFLNLVRPLQVMREVWRESDPSRRSRPQPASLVGWWWALLLAANLVDALSFLWLFSARLSPALAPTLDHVAALAGLHVLSNLIDIPAAWVTIWLVGRIADWQAVRRPRGGRLAP